VKTGRIEPIVVNGEGGTMLAGAEGGGVTLYWGPGGANLKGRRLFLQDTGGLLSRVLSLRLSSWIEDLSSRAFWVIFLARWGGDVRALAGLVSRLFLLHSISFGGEVRGWYRWGKLTTNETCRHRDADLWMNRLRLDTWSESRLFQD